MITVAFIALVVAILTAVFSTVTVPDPPTWLAASDGAIGTVFAAAASMGVWVPGWLLLAVIGSVIAVRTFGLVVKIMRMALSLATGGGGNAGG